MDLWAFLQRKHASERRAKTTLPPREFKVTRYMHNPPNIMPNYGRRKQNIGVPKTSVSRVLLYDNITQQQMLDIKLAHIKIEKNRSERLMDLHQRSFSVKMTNRFRQLRSLAQKNRRKVSERDSKETNSYKGMDRNNTFTIDDVKLPKLNEHEKEIILRVNSKSGRKRIYYSYDDDGMFVDIVPLYTFYDNVHDDPRFRVLESRLISAEGERKSDGFAVLSPSYEVVLPKVPTFLKVTD